MNICQTYPIFDLYQPLVDSNNSYTRGKELSNRNEMNKNALVEIITIGDEILYGQLLDTNTQWLSEALDAAGFKVIRKTSIGDGIRETLHILAEAEQRADIILITGGLGPTQDDHTKPAMAQYFNSPITTNAQALEELKLFFSRRGVALSPTNAKQADLPEKCQMISNSLGTAPGMWFEKEGKVFVSMPGVPFEMKEMMTSHVLPKLKEKYPTDVLYHKEIKTAGIGESWLSDKIRDWENSLPNNISLAYLPSLSTVKLRLTAKGDDIATLRNEVEQEIARILPIIQPFVYGYDQDTLEQVVGRLLIEQKKTLALAESCTGGHISHLITSVPGSSAYFQGSLIPYHNDFKAGILGVNAATLEQHGAVSEATVIEMANNVRKLFKASFGIASSGIAGPDGGTAEKPVGTVWLALSDGVQTVTKKLSLGRGRLHNIQSTSTAALYLLWQSLTRNG